MTEVIGVRFKKVGKVYYFDPCGVQVEKDIPVIVETARGLEYGEVAMSNTPIEEDKIVQPLKKLVRLATEADQTIMEQNLQFEKDALRICEEKISKHKLEMKLVSAEYTFDHSKLLFYFSADGRVDFRELVKDLASVFRTRIELRQIGVRDEAKMIGGLGVCGRPLCCSSFLESFQPVSINMAKDQGLSLNPTKISGTCGRLMCCLKYENDAYQDLIRQTPPDESLVDTPFGRGTIIDSSLLRGTCRVRLQNNPDSPMTVACGQCSILRRGRDKGDHLTESFPPPPLPIQPDDLPASSELSEESGSSNFQKTPQTLRTGSHPRRRPENPRTVQRTANFHSDKSRGDKQDHKAQDQGKRLPTQQSPGGRPPRERDQRRNHNYHNNRRPGQGKSSGNKPQE